MIAARLPGFARLARRLERLALERLADRRGRPLAGDWRRAGRLWPSFTHEV